MKDRIYKRKQRRSGKTQRRRAAGWILAGILSVGMLLTGCGAGEDGKVLSQGENLGTGNHTSAKQDALDVWIFFDENTPGTYYIDLWEELGTQLNCDVRVKTYSTEQIKDKLRISLACRELPDVFAVWGGNYPNFLFDAGACLPVQAYLKASGLEFQDSYTVPYKDGNNYIIPCLVEAYAVTYCNEALMEKIGLKQPENWEDLVELIEKVNAYNAVNGTDYAAIELGDKDSWLGELLYTVLVNQQDPYAQEKLALGSLSFEDPVFVNAAKKLTQLVELGAFPKDFLETGEVEAIENFIHGEAVFFPHQSTIMYYLMDSMGSEGFSILPFPNCGEQADPGQSRYMVDINHTLTPGLCISSQTEQPDLAAQLCLLFAREVNKRNVTQYGYLDLMENSGLQMPEQLSPPAEQFHSMMDQAVHYMPLWYAVLEKEDGDSWRNMTKKLLGRSIDIQTFIRESERYLNFTS